MTCCVVLSCCCAVPCSHLNRKYMNAIVEQPLFLANKAPRARVPSSIYVPPPLQVRVMGTGGFPGVDAPRVVLPAPAELKEYPRLFLHFAHVGSFRFFNRPSAHALMPNVCLLSLFLTCRPMVWAGTPSSTKCGSGLVSIAAQICLSYTCFYYSCSLMFSCGCLLLCV